MWFYSTTIQHIKIMYEWLGSRVHTPYADVFLGLLFYVEAICFLPTDPMLALYCIERREKSLRYAFIATTASVLGGITGYLIGMTLWDKAGEQILHIAPIRAIVSPELFAYLAEQFRKYEWCALLIAGFSPIPYKAATLTAGFCKISFIPFVLCSFIARGTRFFGIAITIKLYGNYIKNSLTKSSIILIGIAVLLFIGILWHLR
jgi:membrane protein YqaA with SNARE-associated domain